MSPVGTWPKHINMTVKCYHKYIMGTYILRSDVILHKALPMFDRTGNIHYSTIHFISANVCMDVCYSFT